MAGISSGLVTGLTSTPEVLARAIGRHDSLDHPARRTSRPETADPLHAVEVEMARISAGRLLELHRRTSGGDGLVTVPVPPLASGDAAATALAAENLWAVIDRPNVLVGLVGTRLLLGAITVAAACGVPLNVRGLRSPEHAEVLDAVSLSQAHHELVHL